MSRIRIEGLLAAFPKLVGSGDSNTQHTYIETESVRYVYQPIEDLFLLLITNKTSNIVEDLDTLRQLSKLVPDVCGGVTEEKVSTRMFELIFAFDEVITFGGHRENVTMSQIQVNLAMESHEEKLFDMIEASKVSSAKESATQKAKEIQDRRSVGQNSKMTGIEGGSSMGGSSDAYGNRHMSASGTYVPPGPSSSTSSFSAPSSSLMSSSVPSSSTPSTRSEPTLPKKGMQLGGGTKKQSMMDKLVSEDNLAPAPPPASSASTQAIPPPAVPEAAHPINILVEEKVSGRLNREGTVETLEIKGTMFLTCTQDDATRCKINLGPSKNSSFSFQTNPKVDKKAFEATNVLALKDASKSFPKNKALGVLRWSASNLDDSFVPIAINCWPEEDGPNMNVTVEYTVERDIELHSVRIVIPLGTNNAPNVETCDSGTARHNRSHDQLVWDIELIDSSNKSASLEFSVAQRDAEAFFPIEVNFASPQVTAGLSVGTVLHVDSGEPIQHGVEIRSVAENYQVE